MSHGPSGGLGKETSSTSPARDVDEETSSSPGGVSSATSSSTTLSSHPPPSRMHELFMQVLKNRDLSRAGDLFSVPDSEIVQDLTLVLNELTAIASLSDYAHNDNDQSVVEICVTRVTSCIRETGSVEQHCEALVNLLESCLHHNLQLTSRDEDPPHAKISSDIISCIFLNYSKKSVMECALPVAVKFLHKGNKELSRNMASYLSLAAIEHASLLSPHVQHIVDSLISGNYPLCKVLAHIYEVSPEPLQGHTMALVSLLPHCDNQEKLILLNLFSLIAKDNPTLLEASVPQLCEYLNSAVTAAPTLQVFIKMAEKKPALLADHVNALKLVAQRYPHTVCQAAQVISAVGKLSRDRAQDALNFVLEYLPKADRGSQGTLLREATLLCSSYPVLFTDKVLAGVRQRHQTSTSSQISQQPSSVSHPNSQITSGGVTIVKVGGGIPAMSQHYAAHSGAVGTISGGNVAGGGGGGGAYTRRTKLGNSRSTGRLASGNNHQSMTRINTAGKQTPSQTHCLALSKDPLIAPGSSVGGLHKSMTRLSSSQQINAPVAASSSITVPSSSSAGGGVVVTSGGKWAGVLPAASSSRVSSGGVTVTTISPRIHRPHSQGPLTLLTPIVSSNHSSHILINPIQVVGSSQLSSGSTNGVTVSSIYNGPVLSGQVSVLTNPTSSGSAVMHSIPVGSVNQISVGMDAPGHGQNGTLGSGPVNVSGPSTVTTRRSNNTSVTIVNTNQSSSMPVNQRGSVFEPYPMRDTVQHFCEKHLDKIKQYMDKVSTKIPPPAKCTIEERRHKKSAKLHFACQVRGQHCLYSRCFFTTRTRNPRIWIHIMFLALQARSPHALSSRDANVSSLKHCWDMLKWDNKTFVTLVTSAFPCSKDQEVLLSELRNSGFFDVFQLCSGNSEDAPNSGTVVSDETARDSITAITPADFRWGCFLCAHPERAVGLLRGDTQPVIEGQLKEKKGKWKLFRRWRTRYFTLSGAHLSCRGSSGGESIDINQIRSVKVSRGARNIPKAFEIFTGNQSLILKPKDGKNAEEWVQCLSIVVAHSHAKEMPAKSNSLPARSLGASRSAI